jgi:type IX secretion system PorP/SprF family membrane protein
METLKKLLLLMFLVSGTNLKAQDPHFSQYFSNPLLLNPAFAGSAGCSRLALNFRTQWPDLPGNYNTVAAAYDQYSTAVKGGVGINYLYDVAGSTLFSNSANVCYALPVKLSETILVQPAMTLGMGSSYIDAEQFTPAHSFLHNPVYFFNVGAGAVAVYKNLIGGFAFDHINQPDIRFDSARSTLPLKLTVHLSGQFNLSERIAFTPMIIFLRQDQFKELMPYALFHISRIKFGAGFRTDLDHTDSFIFMLGYQNNLVSIGYTYDLIFSRFSNGSSGSHEISLWYKFNGKNKPAHSLFYL